MPIKISVKKEIKRKIKFKLSTLENITKAMVLICVVLLPVFIGLGKVNILDFNKQAFLMLFGCLSFLIWFLSQMIKGEFIWRPQILSFLAFGFLIAVLISTVFSRWQWASFWGWPHDTVQSFLTIFCFFIVYFLIANIFRNSKQIFRLHFLLIISGALAAVLGILQLFNKFLLPWDFTKAASFNTIGTVNSFAVFLGALIGPVLALIFATKGKTRNILLVLGLFIFIGLAISNYWVAWLEVLVSTIILLTLGLWKIKEVGVKFLIIPTILFSLALIFGVFKVSMPDIISLPIEVSPSLKTTFNVSKNMLQASTKDSLLGWGPGTFKYGWSKFKNVSLNQTLFWNVRFSKGGSEILEMLGNIGVLGAGLYILTIVFAVYIGAKQFLILQKQKKSLANILFLGTFCGFASLSIVKFLYPANVSLGFLWWIFLANLTAFASTKEKVLELKPDSKEGFLFSFLTILLSIGAIFLFYVEGTRYLAEAKYDSMLRTGGTVEAVETKFLSIIRLNPHQEIFFRDLGQFYLLKANKEALRTDISNQDKMNNVAVFIRNAVAATGKATNINPENVLNWQTRGNIYKNLIGLSDGAAAWAIKCYEKALELEPTNPFILLEISRVYASQASLAPKTPEAEGFLKKAEDTLRDAINLKSDYAPAFYQMALIYNAQGKTQEAIKTLESLKQASTFLGYNAMQDVGLAFQLGILHYQTGQNTNAQAEFERAIQLNPNYANARYFLAMTYDRSGQTGKAIEQLEIIEQSNPGNENVEKALANLRAGKSITGDQVPTELPIEEKPEEK